MSQSLQSNKTDFCVLSLGKIVQVRPVSDRARVWLRENTDSEAWQWLGGCLHIDYRTAKGLFRLIGNAGLCTRKMERREAK